MARYEWTGSRYQERKGKEDRPVKKPNFLTFHTAMYALVHTSICTTTLLIVFVEHLGLSVYKKTKLVYMVSQIPQSNNTVM